MQQYSNSNRMIGFVTVFLIYGLTINAQDIITKRDGSEIKAKVIEIGIDEVKYTGFGTTSPTYTLSKSELFMINDSSNDKIIELNDSRLVTENSKGEQHTKKRIKRVNVLGR
jgi:hypothetical protein